MNLGDKFEMATRLTFSMFNMRFPEVFFLNGKKEINRGMHYYLIFTTNMRFDKTMSEHVVEKYGCDMSSLTLKLKLFRNKSWLLL